MQPGGSSDSVTAANSLAEADTGPGNSWLMRQMLAGTRSARLAGADPLGSNLSARPSFEIDPVDGAEQETPATSPFPRFAATRETTAVRVYRTLA